MAVIHTYTPRCISLSAPSLSFSVDNPNNICLSLKNSHCGPVIEGADPRDYQVQRKGDAGGTWHAATGILGSRHYECFRGWDVVSIGRCAVCASTTKTENSPVKNSLVQEGVAGVRHVPITAPPSPPPGVSLFPWMQQEKIRTVQMHFPFQGLDSPWHTAQKEFSDLNSAARGSGSLKPDRKIVARRGLGIEWGRAACLCWISGYQIYSH